MSGTGKVCMLIHPGVVMQFFWLCNSTICCGLDNQMKFEILNKQFSLVFTSHIGSYSIPRYFFYWIWCIWYSQLSKWSWPHKVLGSWPHSYQTAEDSSKWGNSLSSTTFFCLLKLIYSTIRTQKSINLLKRKQKGSIKLSERVFLT